MPSAQAHLTKAAAIGLTGLPEREWADLSPIHEGLGPVPCGECPPLTARLSLLFFFQSGFGPPLL